MTKRLASQTNSSIHQLWLALFGLWLVLLSGWFHPWIESPGIQQAIELKAHLAQRKEDVKALDQRLSRLENRARDLKLNPQIQSSEIRRVLGFVSADEIVFDFVPSNP